MSNVTNETPAADTQPRETETKQKKPAKAAKRAKNAKRSKKAKPGKKAKPAAERTNKKAEVIAMMKRAKGATLYGVSCDAAYSQSAFREKLGVSIEQLSDFEPKGATCRAFGVYHPLGFPQRALVIVGPDGLVKWSYQAPTPLELPGANLIFDGLQQAAAG